jgi:hypothetical protein
LSLRTAEIVREIADRLAPNRDGFFVFKYASSMPNDQAITYRLIPVIRATGTCFRSPVIAWDDAGLHTPLTAISGPND